MAVLANIHETGAVKEGQYVRILNCLESRDQEQDWGIDAASRFGNIVLSEQVPNQYDLRADWWQIRDQKSTGACVGFAAADGVLRWHLVKKKLVKQNEDVSVRFIWMACKETDVFNNYPTTFIESSGTQTKQALRIARRYGCVLEKDLPMSGKLSPERQAAFYANAATRRINSFYNLGQDLETWRRWIFNVGPILTRLNVDATWKSANDTKGQLKAYDSQTRRGGHAVALVGYDEKSFTVRNSWGTDWGDKGFAYASNQYAFDAFTEAYGVSV